MKKILLSINPKFVKEIREGRKIYEYRKKLPKDTSVKSLLIYETVPTKKIVAECTIENYLRMYPEELWEKTSQNSGISKEFYDAYFKGKESAGAFKLKDIHFFDEPRDLKDYNVKKAPQSYQYIEITSCSGE